MAFKAKSKFLPRFPSTVLATAPLAVAKSGGTYTFAYNPSVLTTTGTPSATAKLVVRDGTTYYETLANSVGNVATGVTAGAYTNMNATVDAFGRIMAAADGAETIINSTDIASISSGDQALIRKGVYVFTSTDNKVWKYTGSGSKTVEASYYLVCDKTPEWTAVQNKPTVILADGSVPMAAALAMGTQKITGLSAGTDSTDAVNKSQLDAMLPKAGGTMTGAINMGSQSITNLATPTNASDAVTKAYVDTSATSAYILSTDYLPTSGVVTQAQFDSLLASAASSGKAIYVPANAVHDMGSTTKVLSNSKIMLVGKGTLRRSGVIAAPILEFQGGTPVIVDGLAEYTAASTPVSGAVQPFLFNGCDGARASGVRAIGKWYVVFEDRDGIGDVIENCFASGAVNRAFYHTSLTRQSYSVKFINNTALCYEHGTSTRLTAYGMNMNSFALAAASISNAVYTGNTVIGAANHGAGLSDILIDSVFSGNTLKDCNTSSPAILVQPNAAYNRRPNGLTIIGNSVQGGSLGVQVVAGDNITVTGNTFRDCTGAAFHLTALKDGLIEGNNINMPAGGYIGYLFRQPSILDVVGGSSISVDCTDVLFEGNKSRQAGSSASNGGYQNVSSNAVRAAVKNNTLNNCGFVTVSTFALNYNNDSV